MGFHQRVVAVGWLLLCAGTSACAPPADPARAALSDRLKQETRLSDEELGRFRDEVARAVAEKTFYIEEGTATRELRGEQRATVFSVLSNPAGVYDEGLRREGPSTLRVLNGPGRSMNAEIEASQRLWVDVETLLPIRYQFAYAFPGYGDYALELVTTP